MLVRIHMGWFWRVSLHSLPSFNSHASRGLALFVKPLCKLSSSLIGGAASPYVATCSPQILSSVFRVDPNILHKYWAQSPAHTSAPAPCRCHCPCSLGTVLSPKSFLLDAARHVAVAVVAKLANCKRLEIGVLKLWPDPH